MLKREKRLECPFTWDIIEDLSARHNDDTELSVTVKDQPAIALMNGLMAVYCATIQKDYEKAKRKIAEVDELRDEMNVNLLSSENISTEVLSHIAWSTIFHVHELAGEDSIAADLAFEQISDIAASSESPMDTATIHGCKAIAFSYFHESAHQQAIIHSRKAVEIFPECPLWNFILYKNLRRARRTEVFGAQPSDDERDAIFECTRMSIEPLYLIHQAQMYRECKEADLASIVYQLVYDAEPDSTEVLLRLANGLMKSFRVGMARVCLDKVERRSPDNPMYLQYRGLYFCALKRYEEAAACFKAAAACGMYVADVQFLACKMKADKSFDQLEYLSGMLERYRDANDRQDILLLLAMQYRNSSRYSKACERFVEAIQINPRSQQLKNFKNRLTFNNKKIYNVFEYVNKFIPFCKKNVDPAVIQKLKELCKEEVE